MLFLSIRKSKVREVVLENTQHAATIHIFFNKGKNTSSDYTVDSLLFHFSVLNLLIILKVLQIRNIFFKKCSYRVVFFSEEKNVFWKIKQSNSSCPDMENENSMGMYLVFVSNSAECCVIVEAHKPLCNSGCNKCGFLLIKGTCSLKQNHLNMYLDTAFFYSDC